MVRDHGCLALCGGGLGRLGRYFWRGAGIRSLWGRLAWHGPIEWRRQAIAQELRSLVDKLAGLLHEAPVAFPFGPGGFAGHGLAQLIEQRRGKCVGIQRTHDYPSRRSTSKSVPPPSN